MHRTEVDLKRDQWDHKLTYFIKNNSIVSNPILKHLDDSMLYQIPLTRLKSNITKIHYNKKSIITKKSLKQKKNAHGASNIRHAFVCT